MQFKMCCNDLNELMKNSGKKGFSIIPKSSDDLQYFCLQSRAVDNNDIEYLKNIINTDFSVKITLIIQRGIKFCPFCGTDLKKIIKKNKNDFKVYVKELEKYAI